MNQCPYRIKEAAREVYHHCRLEDGHDVATRPHVTWGPPRGTQRVFEGIWHKPGEKSTAEPEVIHPAVVSCWTNTRPLKILKEATSTQTPTQQEVRSTK